MTVKVDVAEGLLRLMNLPPGSPELVELHLSRAEWTAEVNRPNGEIWLVDQDGNVIWKKCGEHGCFLVAGHPPIPNMVSLQRRVELENSWYWYCPECWKVRR